MSSDYHLVSTSLYATFIFMEHLSRRRRFVVRVLAVFMIGAMVLFAVAPLAGF